MALIGTFTKFGVDFEGAYTRVQNIEYINGKEGTWVMSEDPEVPPTQEFNKSLKISFIANTYSSPSAADEELLNTKQHYFTVEDASDIIGSCYDYLKSLPEFEDSIDS